ncbi:MAG: tetratricopeptide repeat protein [Bacteroidetes bacterium]|nr:MAG: tetratricopeptide repeat protein [Bacteroidota bacterium]
MNQARQLAAIMFTDIVGYTGMMQADEQKAVAVIKHYNSSLEELVKQYNGQVLNYYGDGSLCIFQSATDAANCALAVQKELKNDPAVPLRIGLHIGEVFFENEKALGDGVNVASRVQSLGQENNILVSAEFHDKIKNNSSFTSISLGQFEFKNVRKPLEIFALTNEGLSIPQRSKMEGKLKKRSGKKQVIIVASLIILFCVAGFLIYKTFFAGKADASNEQSIAVLPFVDMSPAKDQEYFSDGMSEELLNLLAKIQGLKVISRTSSFSFKGKNLDVRKIGENLGVDNILEGSIRKSGNTIRITAQLIEVSKGTHLWSETYDRELKDVFALQDEISKMIVDILKIKLSGKQPNQLAGSFTKNPEAYEDYLKGRYHWNTRTDEGIKKAIGYFQDAIKKDSNYAGAYSGLADTYLTLYDYELMSFDESTSKAKDAALRALKINENLAEAHNSLAHIDLHEWKWKSAEEGFRKAIALDQSYVLAHHWFALCLTAIGKTNEAVTQMEKARELDPLSTRINADLGMAYISAGRYDDAISQEQKTLELNPKSAGARWIRGMAYQQKKMFGEAIKDYQSALELSHNNPNFLAALGHVYASSGNIAGAHKVLDTLFVVSKQEPVSPFFFALVYAGLNDKEKALEWLQKAYEEKSGSVRYLKMEPRLQNLRNDPRYIELMKKIGLYK